MTLRIPDFVAVVFGVTLEIVGMVRLEAPKPSLSLEVLTRFVGLVMGSELESSPAGPLVVDLRDLKGVRL